jgi:serine phosphatase RsbU (regulator of sigma subunit)/TPR repeat protein
LQWVIGASVMKRILPFFLLALIISGAKTDRKTDSLRNLLSGKMEDTARVITLSQLFMETVRTDIKQADALADSLLRFSLTLNDPVSLGYGYNIKGISFYNLGKFDSAIAYYKKALEYREKAGRLVDIGITHNNMGNAYKNLGKLDEAAGHVYRSIRIKEEVKDSLGMAISLNALGVIQRIQGLYSKAVASVERSVLIGRLIRNDRTLAYALNNLGNIYLQMAESGNDSTAFEKALPYYAEALALKKKMNDLGSISVTLTNLGTISFRTGKYNEAERYFLEAIEYGSKVGDKASLSIAYLDLGNFYFKARKDHARALQYVDLSFGIARASNLAQNRLDAYFLYATIHSEKKDFGKAFNYLSLYTSLKDSLFNVEKNKQITEMSAKYESEKKDKEIITLNKDKEVKDAVIARQETQRNAFIVGFLLVAGLAFLIYRGYRQKQKANVAISSQKAIIEEKQKEILDSIHYAQKIQHTLLAEESLLKRNLRDYFVLYMPKDIVSGDFYWAAEKGDEFFLAVCDSTGHGVPGAFMSLLNISFLNEAISEKNLSEPGQVFDHARQRLMLSMGTGDQKDGFDGILLRLDKKHSRLAYAAAHNAPLLVRNGKLTELEADKMPVGKGERENRFRTFSTDVKEGDQVYLCTDGYADQFGGEKGKKFKYKQLYELLAANSGMAMEGQKEALKARLLSWQGALEQVDDILVIAIRI